MEIFKPIFNGHYEISNFGNVKSNLFKIPRLLKPDPSTGYNRVKINRKWYYVHKLVALNFVKNVSNKPFVNHIDKNKLNNHYTNLEWVTARENITHGIYGNNKYTGIHKLKNQNTYQVKIYLNGEAKYLGSSTDIKKAKKIYLDFIKNNNIKNKYLCH